MDRCKEYVDTVRVSVEAAPTGFAPSDDVYKQLRKIVRALARSAAFAEHKSEEKEPKDQT